MIKWWYFLDNDIYIACFSLLAEMWLVENLRLHLAHIIFILDSIVLELKWPLAFLYIIVYLEQTWLEQKAVEILWQGPGYWDMNGGVSAR